MTRKDFETIAQVLAKHHASEQIVAALSAEFSEMYPAERNSKGKVARGFDPERFRDAALPLSRTVYVASAWWHDCEPFVVVAVNNPKTVERAIFRAMRDAATDAYNGSEPEDSRKVRDYLADICWTGVDGMQFDSVIPARTIESYESDNPHYTGDIDYTDYVALRDGERDAIVYLPTC